MSKNDWRSEFDILEKEGFYAVEASLLDVAEDPTLFFELLRKHGLHWICGLYTSWDDYVGPWKQLSIESHFANFKSQLDRISKMDLQPVHVNCHSGSDSFTLQESLDFFGKVDGYWNSQSAKSFTLSHETHRGRILYSPWVALEVVRAFPGIKFTLDISHWNVVAERHLEEHILRPILERVSHIHARIGTPQQSQVADPVDPDVQSSREACETIWKRCCDLQRARGEIPTITPEYGPAIDGYMPLIVWSEDGSKAAVRTLKDIISAEAKRLNVVLS